MTKQEFLTAYQEELIAAYAWAYNHGRLAKYMAGVIRTLDGAKEWAHDSDCARAAWLAIGGKGKPTLEALRALP